MNYIYVVSMELCGNCCVYSASYEDEERAIENCKEANISECGGYSVARVSATEFLNAFRKHNHEKIPAEFLTNDGKVDHIVPVDSQDIFDFLDNDDNEILYVVLGDENRVFGVSYYYDEEGLRREFYVEYIGEVSKIECLIAAEDNDKVEITGMSEGCFYGSRTVYAQDILDHLPDNEDFERDEDY